MDILRNNFSNHAPHPLNSSQFVGTPVTPVLEAASVEQSSDPSLQPNTELPPDYSGDSHKENGTEQAGNNGVQEGEQMSWELSGESSAESIPKTSVEPSQEPTKELSTEMSGKTHFVFDCPCY